MQHSCSHYNAFRSIPWQTRTYLRTWQHQMMTMKQPFHCNLQPEIKNRIELRTQTQRLVAKHIGGTIRAQNDRSRTRRTDEVPFIVGCSHFTRKNTRFGAPASSQNRAHATFMQPLQCVSQHPVANPHLSTHVATSNDDMKQPCQCNLQPEIQEPHRTTAQTPTTRCKTHRRKNSRTKRPQPHPSHRRGTFHRRLQPLYTEKHKVWCSASSPKHSPCNIHAAIYNAFRNIRGKPAPIYARGNIKLTTMKQPFQCNLQPEIQEPHRTMHTDTTTRCKTHRRNNSRTKRPQPHPSHKRGTFIAGCSHFTRKNTRFRARLPPQNRAHATFMQPFQCVSHKVSCSGFVPNSPLPLLTLPIVTTSHRHHLPSSTSLRHHFPSSPLPIVPTSLPHHSPSSSLPFVTTSPSSPLPFVTTSLRHHFPIVTTSLRHHFPSSPLPFVTTRHYHHPSSKSIPLLLILLLCIVMLCIVM